MYHLIPRKSLNLNVTMPKPALEIVCYLNQHCVVPKQFKGKINKHLFAYQLYDTYSPLFRVWVILR